MRIMYVTSLYIPWVGGLEIFVRQLNAEMRPRGHETIVVTSHGNEAPAGISTVDGVPVHRLSAYGVLTNRDASGILQLQADLTRIAVEFQPDVVHAHDGGPMLWMYMRAMRKRRAPVIVTLHNVMTHHFEGSLDVLARLLEDADAVTGVSEAVAVDTLTYAPSVEPKLSVIPNGIVPPVEHPTSVREAPVRLACIGRLVPQKGFDLAIRAMPEVLAHHPHVRMSIVGGGPDGRALVELARELGVEKNIDFEGIVDRDRVASLLAECRAVVMPSRFEGLPLVALEAGWAARPVVGATAPGLSEAIFDGDNAITVPMEDPPALARAIERLVEDRDLAERLGCRGRERAERDHSLVTCADAYERLYEKVVSSA